MDSLPSYAWFHIQPDIGESSVAHCIRKCRTLTFVPTANVHPFAEKFHSFSGAHKAVCRHEIDQLTKVDDLLMRESIGYMQNGFTLPCMATSTDCKQFSFSMV